MTDVVKPSALYEAVKAAFASEGWLAREVPEHEVLEADFEGEDGKVSLHVQTFEKVGAVSVVARPGVPVAEDRRDHGAEMLMRMNLQLTVGAFEMNPDVGEVFFRVTNIFPDGRGDGKILVGLVQTAIAEADRAIPLLGMLNRVIAGTLPTFSVTKILAEEGNA